MMKKYFNIILLLAISLFGVTNSIVYYVVPDDKYYSSANRSTRTFTLQHFLNNTSKYFKPHTVLSFKHGHHTLYKDLMLQDVNEFTINGNNSTFSCIKSSLGIAIINVTNITIKNLHINQCSKDYTINLKHKSGYTPLATKTALFVNHSADVVITNISITVNNNTSGIIGINIFMCNLRESSITNISVLGLCDNSTFNSVSGIALYYNDNRSNFSKVVIQIKQFNCKTHGLCNNSYALRLIMMHKRYNVTMQVHDTNFSNLSNSSALLYYAESCRNSYQKSSLTFFNCKIS